MNIEALEQIKEAVHNPLNYKDYNNSYVQDNTNCFAHAIGSTVTADRTLYRLGMISEKKPIDQQYFSEEEVKNLFLSDTKVLGLEITELEFRNKGQFLTLLDNLQLNENEHIVVLFVKKYFDQKIHDFHFLRYDYQSGWTEHYRSQPLSYLDTRYSWPSFCMEVVGAFKIAR